MLCTRQPGGTWGSALPIIMICRKGRSVSDIEGLMNDLNNKKTGVNLKLGEMR